MVVDDKVSNKNRFTCKICKRHMCAEIIKAKEMMMGLKDVFYYARCASCGSLSMLNVPKDLSKYYPKEYSRPYNLVSSLKLYSSMVLYRIFATKAEGLVNRIIPSGNGIISNLNSIRMLLKISGRHSYKNLSLLDIGARTGDFLKKLQLMDFKELEGIDPFIEKPIKFGKVRIAKTDIFHINRKFDFIVMNHSIEHVKDPLRVLHKLRKLVKNGSVVLIRTPVADSYAFRKYRENWNGLDPSRHLVIFTRKSMRIAARKEHFDVVKEISDTVGNNFVVSEMYKRGIPLWQTKQHVFNSKHISQFDRLAVRLNSENRGDTVAFYLKAIPY